jgi:hypothetical protein
VAVSRRTAAAALAIGLGVLTVAVYAPTRSHAFLAYDDDIYVTANEPVRDGLTAQGLAWAFTSFHGANWFPLTRLSWMLDAERAGLDASAFHTTDIALHLLATLLLFGALLAMTGAPGPSAFVSAVFAVHPLHVESVAWVSSRKDVLSGVFFMAALWIHASASSRRGLRVAGTTLAMALGLMAKPMLVTLPFVLLLLDAWPLGRLAPRGEPDRIDAAALRRALVEKTPLFALAAAMSVVTVLAQEAGGALGKLEAIPLGARLANAAVSVVHYLADAFWPTGLAIFHPHPVDAIPAARVAGAVLGIVALTVGALLAWRRAPALLVGWLWFLGMLVPVIGVVQVGAQARADRYTYLPLVGLGVAVAWGLPALLSRALGRLPARAAVLGGAGALAVAALATATCAQLAHWKDTETVMRHALSVTEENPIAHAYLGVALLARGDATGAAAQWREAARIEPGDRVVANNLAWLLATSPDPRVRDGAEAVTHAERAARITGGDPSVLDTLATAYAAAGRFDRAVETAEQAARGADAAGNEALARQARQRAALFRRGIAWTER